jgi:chromosome segregation ATPase
MNNRPSPLGVANYRQEDERKRDEARFDVLQGQIDEMRQVLRELAGRQVRAEEAFKQYEGTAAQNKLLLDQIRHEAHQTAQARALDENRTRQQLGDLETRLEDAVRPIRSLQAHVAELLEMSRRKTDDTGQYQKRFEEMRVAIEHANAVGDRNTAISHQLRDAIESVREETDQVRRDILRTDDAVKIVDQEARRRVADVSQVADSYGGHIAELRSDIAHAFDLIEETKRALVPIDPVLEELREFDAGLRQDLTRFQEQFIERIEAITLRFDDIRQESDAQFDDVRQSQEQRYERLVERIEATGEIHRQLGFRISAVVHELDGLRQIDERLRRDIWHLHEQRVRLRLEQVQQELDVVTGQRRDAEATASFNGDPDPRAPEF